MSSPSLSDDFIGQRRRRIDNLSQLKERGITPYPAQSRKDARHAHIIADYANLADRTLTTAGRMTRMRVMGKIVFLDLTDESGRLQICIKKDEYPSQPVLDNGTREQTLTWDELKLLDVGDFVQCTGVVGKTQSGEVTLFTSSVVLLSKSLRPFPNSLDDRESQYRRRYLDMSMHPQVREMFTRKATFWRTIRTTLSQKGFTEVFLPVLEHTTGGADARPFMTHHNTLDEELYLRISLELYSKRCIGAGFEKVFSIGPVFRNEGMSDEHANEFNHIEWYWAYADYRDQMRLTREVMTAAAQSVYGKTTFETRGHTFDLAQEWQEIDYCTIIKDRFGVDVFETPESRLCEVLTQHGVRPEGAQNRHRLVDSLWKLIRKTISGPAFLVNEPAFMSPLSKPRQDDHRLTERFHVLIAGTELANGYSEINDPQYQLEQFLNQQKMRDSGDDEAQMLDIDFVEMLEYGMPPTTGLGFSERYFWFLENVTAREGTMFPILRTDTDPLTKKIYPFLQHEAQDAKQTKNSEKNEVRLPSTGVSIVTDSSASNPLPFTRDQAYKIVTDHIQNKGLQKHCLAVEAAMRALAKYFQQDEELWGVSGLLHDADWEECKDNITQHTRKTVQWIKEMSPDTYHLPYTQQVIRTILAHNYEHNGEPPPATDLEWSLKCSDELTGLIVATALITPNKKLADVTVDSLMKKMGSKSFAAAVDREQIRLCDEKLHIPLTDFIRIVLSGMQAQASNLGL